MKTESFSVIEQNQVQQIVDAQAYSMSGCTDEACAIEFGELLSAEQIILGEVSMIGDKYIINAKIIDVAKGKNIKADNVESDSMADMTAATELLAFKLAGLTFSTGNTVQIARDFGEVLIESNPTGADIYVNGVKKGVSPDLISRIPIGTIRIEARKDGLYAVKDVTVSADTGQLMLQLEEMFGNLFIKANVSTADVYLDGRKLGPIDNGFFKKIEIGTHSIEVRNSDSLWKGNAVIENGISTRVDAYMRPYGTLRYSLPEGVSSKIKSGTDEYSFRGSGSLIVFAGTYDVFTTGGRFEDFKGEIDIQQGRRIEYNPELITIENLEKEYFKNRLDETEKQLNSAGSSSASVNIVLDEIELLKTDMRNSRHDFSDIENKADELLSKASMHYRINQNNERIVRLEAEKAERQAALDKRNEELAFKDFLTWGGLGFLGAGGAGLAITLTSYDSEIADGSIVGEIADSNNKYFYPFIFSTCATMLGAVFFMNGISYSNPPDNRSELHASMLKIDSEITKLQEQNADYLK